MRAWVWLLLAVLAVGCRSDLADGEFLLHLNRQLDAGRDIAGSIPSGCPQNVNADQLARNVEVWRTDTARLLVRKDAKLASAFAMDRPEYQGSCRLEWVRSRLNHFRIQLIAIRDQTNHAGGWNFMEFPMLILTVAGGLVAFVVLLSLVLGSFFTVEQQTEAVVERFGKFVRIGKPGFNFKMPWIERIAEKISLRVDQLDVKVETKTLDNVFVHVTVSVQYYVSKVYEAYYKLEDEKKQITAFVFDVVRARVPTIKLDDVFEKKDDIADSVRAELSGVMEDFGYSILKTLVTDIEPDGKVKESMNEINAAQRLRIAANEKGEADRILRVKQAEAEATSKALQGKGIADQRKAIVDGLRESIGDFREAVPGATAHDVMTLVLLTQYFDTLKEIGASSKSNAILIPHSPGHLRELGDQIRNAMIAADHVG